MHTLFVILIAILTLTISWPIFALDIGARPFVTKEKDSPHWLEAVFPSVVNCTPNDFYYDKHTKQSNSGFLEKQGYSPYKVNDYVAQYKIHEKFFGLDATEIAIPSGTDSIYVVIVSATAKRLATVIRQKTGHTLRIYSNKSKAHSGVAYLVPDNKESASFICFTFQE